MAEWRPKRFWTKAEVAERDGGYAVVLDGRPVKTPLKAELVVPTAPLAAAIAEEWDAQEDLLDPETMPVTRAANSALDKVVPQRPAVVAGLLEYCETDLVCYRADAPEELVARQAEAWDPWIDWVRLRFGVRMVTVAGVIPKSQPEALRPRFERHLAGWSAFQVTGFHDLVTLSGSFVLGLATAEGDLDPGAAWELSQIDETWQSELWGRDDEAEDLRQAKRDAFLAATRFLGYLEEAAS